MDPIQNADEYERRFLEKYFKSQASKKIEKIKKQIESEKDQTKASILINEIDFINNELIENLNSLKNEENRPKYRVELNKNETKNEKTYRKVEIDHFIWEILYDYQKDGVKWFIDLFLESKGGILADEMGLGKTLQSICFISSLFKSNLITNCLIISPSTLVSHWIDEINKNCSILKPSNNFDKHSKVFILSFETFKMKNSKNEFDLVLIDEGHKIKNKDALITKCVKSIKCKRRFILTGTPIQNNLSELWSIFDFIAPGLLGSYNTFQEEFEDKIKKCNSKKEKDVSYHYSMMLRSLIEPHILRRLKSDIVHGLPNKTDKVIFLPLSEKQKKLYLSTIESNRFRKLVLSHGKLLQAIDILRKICNHPILFENISLQGNSIAEIRNESKAPENMEFDQKSTNFDLNEIINSSCKLKMLFEMLEKWQISGCKVLIFSQSVKMISIIEKIVFLKNINYRKMIGSTPVEQRKRIIDEFNNNSTIFTFLLTTRVGGLGLNLVSANRIVIYDPDWNPSSDNQAKERIYRFGQKSEVEIYRLICKNTIEEKIYQKQIYKECLSKKILKDPRQIVQDEIIKDILNYCELNTHEIEIDNYEKENSEEKKGVEIREEDKRNFEIMKEYNLKEVLTGAELIAYIERREMNLNEN